MPSYKLVSPRYREEVIIPSYNVVQVGGGAKNAWL